MTPVSQTLTLTLEGEQTDREKNSLGLLHRCRTAVVREESSAAVLENEPSHAPLKGPCVVLVIE